MTQCVHCEYIDGMELLFTENVLTANSNGLPLVYAEYWHCVNCDEVSLVINDYDYDEEFADE